MSSNLALSNFTPAANALVYQYSAANLAGIVQQPNLAISGSTVNYTYPANSITEIVIPQQGTAYFGGAAANASASQLNTLQPDVSAYSLYKSQTYTTDANGVGTPVTSGVTFSSFARQRHAVGRSLVCQRAISLGLPALAVSGACAPQTQSQALSSSSRATAWTTRSPT